MFWRAIKKLLVQDAPPWAEQSLDEFLRAPNFGEELRDKEKKKQAAELQSERCDSYKHPSAEEAGK